MIATAPVATGPSAELLSKLATQHARLNARSVAVALGAPTAAAATIIITDAEDTVGMGIYTVGIRVDTRRGKEGELG